MKFLLFIIAYIVSVQSLYCDERTKTFLEHGISNNNNFYTVRNTYMRISSDECAKTSPYKFRSFMDTNMKCDGEHCVKFPDPPEKSWACKSFDPSWNTQKCYNVEHIIPTNHLIDELSGCDTNITGNLIMSYGVWNTQLGNTHYGEKELIYGDIWNSAYSAVYKCCYGSKPRNILQCHKGNVIIAIIIMSVVGIISIIIALTVKFHGLCREYIKPSYHYDNGYDDLINNDSMSDSETS